MVTVIFEPPVGLPPNFRHESKASLGKSDSCSGSDTEQFAFRRRVGEILSILDAFQAIACTGEITVKIFNGMATVDGQIVSWKSELCPLLRAAAAEIDAKANLLALESASSRLNLTFNLKRHVKRQVA